MDMQNKRNTLEILLLFHILTNIYLNYVCYICTDRDNCKILYLVKILSSTTVKIFLGEVNGVAHVSIMNVALYRMRHLKKLLIQKYS